MAFLLLVHFVLRDGLVSKASFFKLIEGYIPEGTSIYTNSAAKEEALEKMFNEMDLKYTGVITFDEWLKFCLEHIGAKVATLEAHPILDHGSREEFKTFIAKAIVPKTPEHTELFWYLLEIFIANDSNKVEKMLIFFKIIRYPFRTAMSPSTPSGPCATRCSLCP